jgi:hypothetical protein
MLETCNTGIKEEVLNKSTAGTFLCILHHTQSGEALFIIQESTGYKLVNHLILRLKGANDGILKKHLASLVNSFKAKSENLEKENCRLNDDLSKLDCDLRVTKDELATINSSK